MKCEINRWITAVCITLHQHYSSDCQGDDRAKNVGETSELPVDLHANGNTGSWAVNRY